jgi:hypothetical protein
MIDKLKFVVENYTAEANILNAAYKRLNSSVDELISVLNNADSTQNAFRLAANKFGDTLRKFCLIAEEFREVIDIFNYEIAKFNDKTTGKKFIVDKFCLTDKEFNSKINEFNMLSNILSSMVNGFNSEEQKSKFTGHTIESTPQSFSFSAQGVNSIAKQFNEMIQLFGISVYESYVEVIKSSYTPDKLK